MRRTGYACALVTLLPRWCRLPPLAFSAGTKGTLTHFHLSLPLPFVYCILALSPLSCLRSGCRSVTQNSTAWLSSLHLTCWATSSLPHAPALPEQTSASCLRPELCLSFLFPAKDTFFPRSLPVCPRDLRVSGVVADLVGIAARTLQFYLLALRPLRTRLSIQYVSFSQGDLYHCILPCLQCVLFFFCSISLSFSFVPF